MSIEHSKRLLAIKPLLKQLISTLSEKYDYASVLATDAISKSYSVSSRGRQATESALFSQSGFTVRVFNQNGCSEYSFNSLSEELLPSIVEEIDATASIPTRQSALPFYIPEDEPLVLDEATECETDPTCYGDGKILDELSAIRAEILAYDDRILDGQASCNFQKYTKIFLSKNRDLTQSVLWTCGGVVALALRGGELKTRYLPSSGIGGVERVLDMRCHVKTCCEDVLALLSSEPMIPGEYDCICSPSVTGMIVHEAFGHGVEMDMFVKKRALAEEYVGKYVASPLVTMHDGAKGTDEVASYFFDDEGTLAHDTVVIENGILKTGISDYLSARRLGTQPTGNGRRESWKNKAYTRMTNTYFTAGKDKVEDMIASVEYGFLLEEASSGMEDPKNWGIQCMVSYAKEIKNGKLTGKIYAPVVLTGYVPDLLKSITMMSDGVALGGSGACGKGYKEWVKVSDGGPYIKAKIRLG